eukprot:CAMPEP_0176019548 /NCGR_PEP_ID=MMETSP0120_2-20121206/9446_1 /TAXON_ID=160619 /ORGANISM="Kryptoperidinium foliaceum, Strain CCMP 1326" /LENGTH=74 /DNA_ID=CAMNT_0017352625 /DNA_START=433 /DNA_END=654 /DNA_ORIENTATION=-
MHHETVSVSALALCTCCLHARPCCRHMPHSACNAPPFEVSNRGAIHMRCLHLMALNAYNSIGKSTKALLLRHAQ